jgi:hypothetical protein
VNGILSVGAGGALDDPLSVDPTAGLFKELDARVFKELGVTRARVPDAIATSSLVDI